MTDITALILDDHETFRRQFALLDDAKGAEALSAIWQPLSDLLDVHAAAEEKIFYPALLGVADPDGEETSDAIGDHNDIRDGVEAAVQAEVGSDEWWKGVNAAREANDQHMGEEENEGLKSFRLNASDELRAELGTKFLQYKNDHPTRRQADTENTDPDRYVEEHR